MKALKPPTPDEINRLEGVAWDAGVDHVLVWERDRRDQSERRYTALLAALKALEEEMRAEREEWKETKIRGASKLATEYYADKLRAIRTAHTPR